MSRRPALSWRRSSRVTTAPSLLMDKLGLARRTPWQAVTPRRSCEASYLIPSPIFSAISPRLKKTRNLQRGGSGPPRKQPSPESGGQGAPRYRSVRQGSHRLCGPQRR
ncbi:unnamed protein product [Leptidea sinapis]|uniref:Uncharacterized protein n=1 Tax=Leptidea sinapis TaxID=189913 RepID=A0A5E4QZP0_9NEOP|nr:unnamed protein product [Leptidea sinapis]